MKFEKWLKRQTHRNDPVGDFARDTFEPDPPILADWRTRMALLNWLRDYGACRGAMRAASSAWYEWKAEARKNGWRKPAKRATISPKLRYGILRRDGFRCRACGAGAFAGTVLHVDHVLAVANGGTNDPANLQTLCELCNLGKGK